MTATQTEGPSSYPPPAEFAEQANAREDLYHEAEQDRLAFWAKQANRLSWATPFTEVLDWSEMMLGRAERSSTLPVPFTWKKLRPEGFEARWLRLTSPPE